MRKTTHKTQRIRQSPKLPAEERREQLLSAAHDLFLQKGYRATSTDEIARRAGLTKGAFYFHFKSKEEMLLTMVRQIVDVFMEEEAALVGLNLSPEALLKELRRIDEQMPMKRARQNLTLFIEIMQVPRIRKEIDRAFEKSTDLLADSIAPAYGRTKAQRRNLVVLIHAVFDGLNFASTVHPGHVDFNKQARLFGSLFDNKKGQKSR
jgi:AcrR family transcriptional regulator